MYLMAATNVRLVKRKAGVGVGAMMGEMMRGTLRGADEVEEVGEEELALLNEEENEGEENEGGGNRQDGGGGNRKNKSGSSKGGLRGRGGGWGLLEVQCHEQVLAVVRVYKSGAMEITPGR